MTMPTVTELPLDLEPVTPDPFIAGPSNLDATPSPPDDTRQFRWWDWCSGAWRDPDAARDFDPSPYSWR